MDPKDQVIVALLFGVLLLSALLAWAMRMLDAAREEARKDREGQP
jgi:hypothetical protein